MFIHIPMGSISKEQSCYKTTYIAGSAWLHSLFYRDHSWESPRCKYPRYSCSRARVFLRYGSSISRLQAFIHFPTSFNLFHYQSQKESAISKNLFSSDQQKNRITLRSNNRFDRYQCFQRLSRKIKTDRLLRCRYKQTLDLFNKQFFTTRVNHYQTLQTALES